MNREPILSSDEVVASLAGTATTHDPTCAVLLVEAPGEVLVFHVRGGPGETAYDTETYARLHPVPGVPRGSCRRQVGACPHRQSE